MKKMYIAPIAEINDSILDECILEGSLPLLDDTSDTVWTRDTDAIDWSQLTDEMAL